MYIGKKTFRFEASHVLAFHDGKCARLHGHSWQATVEWHGQHLNTSGPKENMLVDFGDVSKVVKPLVDEFLDHHHLNETLGTSMPTSEFVARWLFEQLEGRVVGLHSVTVEETCTSEVTYVG